MADEARTAGKARRPAPDPEKYLYQSINESQAYHNQKERMAWLALVMYGIATAATNTAFGQVHSALGTEPSTMATWVTLSIYIVFSLLIALVFWSFMRQQQEMRSVAASLMEASKAAALEMLLRGEVPPKSGFARTDNQLQPDKNGRKKPTLIRCCPDYVYKHFVLIEADQPLRRLQFGQDAIFVLIFVVSVVPVVIATLLGGDTGGLHSWLESMKAPSP